MRENPHTVSLFTEVAPKYEFLNSLMTMGRDRIWRQQCLRLGEKLLQRSPHVILDLATGTGDLARMALRTWPSAKVIGSDPTPAMLEIAKQKSSPKIEWQEGVAEHIKMPDASVDLVTIAFGFRNVDKELRTQAMQEVLRVLKPGGVFAILELGLPRPGVWQKTYRTLLRHGMPRMAGLFSPKEPYHYLAESIMAFPPPQSVQEALKAAGFQAFAPKAFTLGMCWLYLGKKNLAND